ncbi:Omp28 family outer membrane lipoprotein [Bacteroidales bacterium OttesenSCG-928-K03]|nr:Omp28 family outer membrane lipoprotein [Bacteroidales bacterium OttesenSCG-928-L14]MDL2243123.1 Omp28 family outer membrane lipoprotein [Bacteroidales bacterium OttesenSCG-928-K03]
MKYRFLKHILPLVIISLVVACDIIPEDSYLIPIENSSDSADISKRVVLIEEFTGHRCNNCPKAAEEVKKLQLIYGDKLIVMALHTGQLSNPYPPDFITNYRTPEGNEIFNHFNISAIPIGMVNRINYGGSPLVNYGDWEPKIADIINRDAIVNVEFTREYNSDNRSLSINVKTQFIGDEALPTKLCAFITESGMISPQSYGTEVVYDYVHNHVLRTSFEESGTWGIELIGIGAETNSLNVTLKDNWVAENCEIIVYVYNTQTMEILQAAIHHVK